MDIQNLFKSDCLGDALGKINYNFVSLDTNMCNLSSNIYSEYWNDYIEFTSILPTLIQIGDDYSDVSDLKKMYTMVQYLSSYWNTLSIAVEFPIDIETLNSSFYIDNNISLTSLQNIGNDYINNTFASSSYLDGMKITIIFFLYSNSGELIKTETTNPTAYPISQSWRTVFDKQDIHVQKICSFKYQKILGNWQLVETTC